MPRRSTAVLPPPIVIPDRLDASPAFHAAAPDAFVCPLTLRVMKNPVISHRTGRAYDAVAARAWMDVRGSEPWETRASTFDETFSCHAGMYALIEKFVSDCGKLEASELADGAVSARLRRAAENSTVIVVEHEVVMEREPERETGRRSDAFAFPKRRVKIVDPCLDVVSVEYPDAAMEGKTEAEPAGKWFRFHCSQLSEICGIEDWGSKNMVGYKRGVIKGGEGASFNVTPTPSRRNGGSFSVLCFHHESGLGVGCLNPCDYAKAGDFSVGERVELAAFAVENAPPAYTFSLGISEYVPHTETGWNLPGAFIRYGQCGLVGPWWREMEIEFKIQSAEVGTRIFGLHTDASFEALPFTAKALRSDGQWHDIVLSDENPPWGKAFSSVFDDVSSVRVRWESTDLHKLPGSTARSGGGIHANLLGTATSVNVLDVRLHNHPSDGSIFRFDIEALRALSCGQMEAKTTHEVLNLRTGRRGKVMFSQKPDDVVKRYAASQKKTKPKTAPIRTVVVPQVDAPQPAFVSAPKTTGKGGCFCCFGIDEPVSDVTQPPVEPGRTTMVVYKPVYVEEDENTSERHGEQDSHSLDALGVGYWVDAMAKDDWQIGDILMLNRSVLNMDESAPSVLEDVSNISSLERQTSIELAGEWAKIRFPVVENVVLPNI